MLKKNGTQPQRVGQGQLVKIPAAADADADPFVFSTHDNLARAAILFFSSTNKLFWFF